MPYHITDQLSKWRRLFGLLLCLDLGNCTAHEVAVKAEHPTNDLACSLPNTTLLFWLLLLHRVLTAVNPIQPCLATERHNTYLSKGLLKLATLPEIR
jgi:hypothetical protein